MKQTTTASRLADAHAQAVDIHIAAEPSVLAKAVTAFTFSDLTVRPCGHGLPPTLPGGKTIGAWMKF